MRRRALLRLAEGTALGLAGAWPAGCGGGTGLPAAADLLDPGRAPTGPLDQPVLVPKVNGGVNVHPLRCLGCRPSDPTIDPALVALQLRAVYELGFDGIRITAPLGDRASLLAAVPYARAARALGIDALVLLADFSGFTTARALHDSGRRVAILRLYASLFAGRQEPLAPPAQLGGLGPQGTGRVAFQVLNEPVGFVGLPPADYVREVLRPCYQDLRTIDDGVIVVAAAEAGNGHGPPRVRAMLEAGLESVCDRIAYHVYQAEIVSDLPGDLRRVIWITESGAFGTARHLGWVREVFPGILARLPDATRIFFFDLFDEHRGGYRVLDIVAGPGGHSAAIESGALHDYWSARVRESAGGRPLVAFETLVPDVRRYFPTAAEIEAVETAPF
jgi:hypothetical protein